MRRSTLVTKGEIDVGTKSPFWIADEDKVVAKRAPEVGEHSDAVLAAAGYSADEIRRFRSKGVVG